MEVTIHDNGQMVSVEVTEEVYEFSHCSIGGYMDILHPVSQDKQTSDFIRIKI